MNYVWYVLDIFEAAWFEYRQIGKKKQFPTDSETVLPPVIAPREAHG